MNKRTLAVLIILVVMAVAQKVHEPKVVEGFRSQTMDAPAFHITSNPSKI